MIVSGSIADKNVVSCDFSAEKILEYAANCTLDHNKNRNKKGARR